jgi:protein-disulfide isomerase
MSNKREREKRREERLRQEAEAQTEDRRKRLIQLGSGAVFLAIVVVAVLIVVSQSGGGGGSTDIGDVGLVSNQLQGIPQSGTVLGEPKAKVTLVEYGDLQCPVCKEYSEQVLPQVIGSDVRQGRAKIDFRNFTIIGAQSTPAGAAALAAGEQGRGWNFIELFYRNQGTERSGYVTDSFLTALAKAARVPDIAKWNADRKSRRLLREVSRTTAEANNLGFTGTPSFVVQGPNGTNPLGTPGSAGAIESAIQGAGG